MSKHKKLWAHHQEDWKTKVYKKTFKNGSCFTVRYSQTYKRWYITNNVGYNSITHDKKMFRSPEEAMSFVEKEASLAKSY